jgi:hypothetical protein
MQLQEGGETRTAAALMLLHRAVTMAAAPLPNADVLLHSFDAGLEGWPVWGFCEREELGGAAPKFLVPGTRRSRPPPLHAPCGFRSYRHSTTHTPGTPGCSLLHAALQTRCTGSGPRPSTRPGRACGRSCTAAAQTGSGSRRSPR